jgi:NAD-dependent deacetylase
MDQEEVIAKAEQAAKLMSRSSHTAVFTGAGISVESGVPPFRGPGGLWSKYDPEVLELHYFLRNAGDSWKVIKEIFYDHFQKAEPNGAHYKLADWERRGLVSSLITQNIDNLHYLAGSKNIIEYHGNSRLLICTGCAKKREASEDVFAGIPPRCPSCGSIYKPDFVFFGEGIPPRAAESAEKEARKSELMIVIGSTGEVYPAAFIPYQASQTGAKIIEINPEKSAFTDQITDLFIPLNAVEATELIDVPLNLYLDHNEG